MSGAVGTGDAVATGLGSAQPEAMPAIANASASAGSLRNRPTIVPACHAPLPSGGANPSASFTWSEEEGGNVKMVSKASALTLFAALLLAGCGSTSTVADNQASICSDTLGLQAYLKPMVLATNPKGTAAQARANAVKFQAQLLRIRGAANSSQLLLLNRLDRAVDDYRKVLVTLPPETPLASQVNRLDAYQQNVLYEYRSVLNRVGCGSAPPMAPLPTPPPPPPVVESPSESPADGSTDGSGDQGSNF